MVLAKLFDPAAGRQRLDRYELLGEIASGGMATVYLARLTGVGGFQRFVAVKRLHPHLAKENEFVEMFLDEARIAARIHHPNVVPILEVGASAVGYYLVMEYVEGDTLARLLARAAMNKKRLAPPIGLRAALDTLSGLHAAHELRDDNGDPVNLVHRDVSPQNVLVGMDGIARITDFGVARAASRLSATRVGQLKGKIAYMAPEQAAGDEQIDRRADVFSAAIVVWETLAAKRLFKAENEAATLSRVMTMQIPVLHQVASGISKEVSDVVMRGLDRNRDKRFRSCAEFADALEAAAAAGHDKIASPRELAAYVTEAMGEEIKGQRDAVRAWLARSEPSHEAPGLPLGANPSSSVSAAAMAIPGLEGSSPSHVSVSNTMPQRRSKAPLAIAALLVFGLLGAGAFALTRAARAPVATAPPPPAAVAAQPAPTPTPTAEAPAPVATPSAPASAAAGAETAAAEVGAAPKAAARPAAASRPRPAKKKASDDVDLRNPYR